MQHSQGKLPEKGLEEMIPIKPSNSQGQAWKSRKAD
jgi:hypothetical protein